MLKAYKYRIYPTKGQIKKITAQFGCCRYVYNWGLQRKAEQYTLTGASTSCFELIGELTELKNKLPWLKEVYSQSLQMSLRHLDNAYTRFFREKKGFPRFKSRKNPVQSCAYPQGVKFRGAKVFVPKVGPVSVVMHRPLEGTVKTVTLSKSASGKYYLAALVDTGEAQPGKQPFTPTTTVGVDVGITYFATLSTGEKIDNPKYLMKAEKKLIRAQSCGWAEFFSFLDYKSDWYGKSILEIGRFEPSSKTCHACGFINRDLKLKDRMWTCPRCGKCLDREGNAAINIKAFALIHQNLIVPRDTREFTPLEIAGYGGR